MPHARKPKEKRHAEEDKSHNKRNRPSIDARDGADGDESVPMVKSVANVQGQRIIVQTKINPMNMNRPSAFVRLDAEDFASRFQRLWEEHVEGFTGLRGTKRERTEKEKQMEWRQRVKQLANKKTKEVQVKKNGQTVSENERMHAILKYREMKAGKKSPLVAAST